jgi:hypothetical protein
MTGFTVDPWDPGYAAALAVEALSELGATSAELVLDIERPAADWKPVTPGPDAAAPETLLVADGVRRIDARVWVHDPDAPMPVPGIAASYAAGIVRCGPDGADLAEIEVNRALISASPHAPEVKTSHATYHPGKAADASFEELSLALQRQVTQLEVDLVVRHRAQSDDLLLVDGPLRGRTHLPHTVGYIKTHHTAYLPSPQSAVVAALTPGQRTPVFLMGTSWRRHAWYVRLPVQSYAWPTRSRWPCRRWPGWITRTRARHRTSSRSAVWKSSCATTWATPAFSTARCAPPPAAPRLRIPGSRRRTP